MVGESSSPTRNPEIDRLRALAILLTLIEHAPRIFVWHFGLPDWLTRGWAGVSLFFVISGYVVTGSLVSDLAGATRVAPVLKSFFIRRAFRILPVSYFGLLLAYALAAYRVWPHRFSTLPALYTEIVGVLTFTYNFRFMPHTYDPHWVLPWYWSLAVEEQFYLLFPWVLVGARYARWPLRRTVTILFLSSLVIRPFFGAGVPESIQRVATPFNLEFLLAGSALYFFAQTSWFLRVRPTILVTRGPVRALFNIVAVAGLFILPGALTPGNLGKFAAVLALSTILVWLASYRAGIVLPLQRGDAVLRWLASRSYTIYLLHCPIFYLNAFFWIVLAVRYSWTPVLTAVPTLKFTLLFLSTVTPLLIGGVELVYRVIEAPANAFGRRLSKKKTAGLPLGNPTATTMKNALKLSSGAY